MVAEPDSRGVLTEATKLGGHFLLSNPNETIFVRRNVTNRKTSVKKRTKPQNEEKNTNNNVQVEMSEITDAGNVTLSAQLTGSHLKLRKISFNELDQALDEETPPSVKCP